MPDRYADAVRSRRGELRAERLRLIGGHRAEIRTSLALTRLVVAAELAATMAALGREIREHVVRADRAGRRRLPGLVAAAVDRAEAELERAVAGVALPSVRRIAAERSVLADLTVAGITPSGTRPRVSATLPVPEPPVGALRALLLAGSSGGAWRLAVLPVAGLPVLGLPALGGVAVLPLAAALGLVALAATAWARWVAADRARLGRWTAEALAVARSGLEAELGRRLLDLEQRAGAALDVAVARRRADVDAELRGLAPVREEAARAAE
ncbi:hypothetical protein ACVGVM_27390 [Pseudonocardia bannensis]|uniref:Uncharacterized protein n=1 Tax=Pseudonocardia bannensis TaxID=630973 RepID=A0A848DFC4_9PSEU|nr:hypothetical protein [Pseudonocardia bannensis]NMH91342.1 hypothetical protein [Pseudonocardia bannensis]